MDMLGLDSDLRALVEKSQQSRAVTLMVSQKLEVPTAIGFRKPAIILPAWLLESTPAEELKYILLHELAHLSRRDDWTNLAQKVLKAVFFFLPSIWWIERKLSLDREMACDDAVLARSGSPRGYAECLAHIAERSFLRRQFALAQAAVGRVRQLTARVAVILDPNRPRATQMWKPAIPVVIVLAGLSAVPASFTSALVNFADDTPKPQELAGLSQHAVDRQIKQPSLTHVSGVSRPNGESGQAVRVVQASLKTDNGSLGSVAGKSSRPLTRNFVHTRPAVHKATPSATLTALAGYQQLPQPTQEYVAVREELVVMVTEQTASGVQQSWQMHVVEVSLQPQAKPVLKPRKI
jgi:hypothetical protein